MQPRPAHLSAQTIAQTCESLLKDCATVMRPDIERALQGALERERSASARRILTQMIENARIAESDRLPLCQDTGSVWVSIERVGEVYLSGDLQAELDRSAARVWEQQGLRASMVRDALHDRTNTGDNSPVFIELSTRRKDHSGSSERPGVCISVMLKGAGSDNASRVIMLSPSDGVDAIERELVALVEEKASMACPPLSIGIGIGATFDTVASLSKQALLRDITLPVGDARIEALEDRFLTAVNATGIGPAGRGGDTTALGVNVITAPCHIAALPVAINLGCCAVRSRSCFLEAEEATHVG